MFNQHKKRVLAWLLPAVLLFGQQAAIAHITEHASGEYDDPESALVHGKLCNKCLTVEKLSSALVVPGHDSIPQFQRDRHTAVLAAPPHSCEVLQQSCRDPPASI